MTKISFKTLRAASLRVGDIVPAPTAWIVFNLNCGGMFRSFPENKTPVDI
jgi:hypothetical protein